MGPFSRKALSLGFDAAIREGEMGVSENGGTLFLGSL